MSKITLTHMVQSGDVSVINNNFDLIEAELQNKVLYRDNPVREPNTLETGIDANGKRIYNLPEPLSANEAARLQDVQNAMAGGSANLVDFTPSGTIASSNVQAAIQELDSEKASKTELASNIGSELVGFKQDGTGAVLRTVESKVKDFVSVKDFGAVGDGIVDDSASIFAAITAYDNIFFPSGTYLFDSTVQLPNKNIRLFGNATLHSTTLLSNGLLQQQNRGKLTKIEGLSFTGASVGFYRKANDVVSGTPENSEYYEFLVKDCSFIMNSGVYGITLFGSREGIIDKCYFETGNGISLETCINVEISHCIWKTCGTAITEFANTQGTKVIGGTALGCANWFLSNTCEGTLINGVMSDFNDTTISFIGGIDITISDSYISSRTKTAAIYVGGSVSGTPYRRPNNIKLLGNTIVNNYVALNPGYTTHDINATYFEQCNYLTIQSNLIKNWTQAAIVIIGCVNTRINNNTLYQHPIALGTSSVSEPLSDCTATTLHNNTVTTTSPFQGTSSTDIWNNYGYVSEATGIVTATTGVGSVTFNHGLSVAPAVGCFRIIPLTPLAQYWWISAITATQITMNFSANLPSNFTFQFAVSLSKL